jgi:hypothetical protein
MSALERKESVIDAVPKYYNKMSIPSRRKFEKRFSELYDHTEDGQAEAAAEDASDGTSLDSSQSTKKKRRCGHRHPGPHAT